MMKQDDLTKEVLLMVMVGDEVGESVKTALRQFKLIKRKQDEEKYELTQKGLDRLNGI